MCKIENDYTPISPRQYAMFETFLNRGKDTRITYFNEQGNSCTMQAGIVDFSIINKAEYLLLNSGQSIRLDKIVSLH